MAFLSYDIQFARHPVDFTTVRNFFMFIILMPIIYAPVGFLRYLFGQEIVEIK